MYRCDLLRCINVQMGVKQMPARLLQQLRLVRGGAVAQHTQRKEMAIVRCGESKGLALHLRHQTVALGLVAEAIA